MNREASPRQLRLAFILLLIFTLLPVFIFLFDSFFYHALRKCPSVQDGVLDLDGFDLASSRELPLDGKWEYFPNTFLLSDPDSVPGSGQLAQVPRFMCLVRLQSGIMDPGVGSYRLRIRNCPGDIELLTYIPNIRYPYKAFINGTLVASKSDPHTRLPLNANVPIHPARFRHGQAVPAGGEAELVIEIADASSGGLFMTPVLTEENLHHMRSDERDLLAAALIGVLAVAVCCVASFFFARDKSLSSLSLVLLDVLVLLRILFQNDYLLFLKSWIPLPESALHILLQSAILFVPTAFLACAQKLVQLHIGKKTILYVGLYSLCFTPLYLWSALTGRSLWQLLFCLISFAPFFWIMRLTCRNYMRRIPYSLLILCILMLILSSIIVSTLSASGVLVMDITLFPVTCFVLSMFLQLYMYLRRNYELQRTAAETEILRLRLRESETDLMLSQIKPHFLYNALIAIQVLCTREPETAADTVMKFAAFLRANMNFISSREPIPFPQELAHIQNYVDIEKLRFQKRLTVRFDIRAQDFLVPPLSVQPLVENAIRHGACKNIQGGSVLLKSWEESESWCIEVHDDGPGFDPAILNQADGSPHGLQNIQFRLQELMRAHVDITSQPGCGTTVRIELPKTGTREYEEVRP